MKTLITRLIEDRQAKGDKVKTAGFIIGGIIIFIIFIFFFINPRVTLGVLLGIIIFAAICVGTYFLLRESDELPEIFH